MSITLDGITLDNNLIWIDEYLWTAVTQQADVTLDGTLILQESKQLSGRPITLEGAPGAIMTSKATIDLLRAKAETTSNDMTLTLHDARSFTVRFRRDAGPPVEAEMVIPYADPIATTRYSLKLKLIEVA